MFSILQQPFPSQKNTRHTVRMCCIAALCVWAVFYFIKPFGLDHMTDKAAAVTGLQYALVTLVLSLVCTTLLPFLFPSVFDEKHWTVFLEIVFLLVMVLIIALGNVWLTNYIFGSKLSGALVTNTVKYTLVIAVAPVLLSVLIKQHNLLKKYSREARQIEENIPTQPLPGPSVSAGVAAAIIQPAALTGPPQDTTVRQEESAVMAPEISPALLHLHLKGDNQAENLQLAVTDFLFAEAADNYTSIHYLQNGFAKQVLFRVSVKSLAAQAAPAQSVFRCHKSYLVNLQQVEHISGNAQGYTLHLQQNGFEVPVSRTLNSLIKQKMETLHAKK